MLRSSPILLLALLATLPAWSQTVVHNSGQTIFVNSDADVFVQGGDLDNAAGTFENLGEVEVTGAIRNGEFLRGGPVGSRFILQGDWINDASFGAIQSEVLMDGAAQRIGGTSYTTFHDLRLSGTDTKTLDLDVMVDGVLDLTDRELATDTHVLHVLNTDIGAIQRTSGYVSSLGNGRLWRSTDITEPYLFPLGDAVTGDYRPVEMTPTSTSSTIFSGRLVFQDPTTLGYDRSQRAVDVLDVNDRFFHLLGRRSGSADADVRVYYDPATDGSWTDMARWRDVEWTLVDGSTTTGVDFVEKSDVSLSYQDDVIALAEREDLTLYAIPTAFSPNGAFDENRTFHVIDQFDRVEVTDMQVFNRWGELVYDARRDGGDAWNGRFNGQDQPGGTYSYVIRLRTDQGDEIGPVDGTVLLIW